MSFIDKGKKIGKFWQKQSLPEQGRGGMKNMRSSNKTNFNLVAIWDSLGTTMKCKQIGKVNFAGSFLQI